MFLYLDPLSFQFIESDVITFVSDPSLLLINGVHVGVTSTDVLFHMNSLSLFIG